jgi:ribose transport system ATP-binding protein
VVQPASLALHAGEVLGIAGLIGSGRTELLRLIFGADRADKVRSSLATASSRIRSPRTPSRPASP